MNRQVERLHRGKSLLSLPTSYVAVDVETTGIDFKTCDIIDVGAVKVSDGVAVDTFNQLVCIDYHLDPFIVSLTGITDEMLASANGLEAVIGAFSVFVGSDVLLAHNASFDMNFLGAAYKKVLGELLSNDYVDTLRLARKTLPELTHHKMKNVCEALEVSNESEHRALSDSRAVVECYQRMRAIALDKFGDEAGYSRCFNGGGSRRIKARDVQASVEDVDGTSSLYKTRCVFTGKLTSMTRREAMRELKNVGGEPQDNVTRDTDYLVVGNDGVTRDTDYLVVGNDGFTCKLNSGSAKIKKAKEGQLKGQPIQIISEDAFLQMLYY